MTLIFLLTVTPILALVLNLLLLRDQHSLVLARVALTAAVLAAAIGLGCGIFALLGGDGPAYYETRPTRNLFYLADVGLPIGLGLMWMAHIVWVFPYLRPPRQIGR